MYNFNRYRNVFQFHCITSNIKDKLHCLYAKPQEILKNQEFLAGWLGINDKHCRYIKRSRKIRHGK